MRFLMALTLLSIFSYSVQASRVENAKITEVRSGTFYGQIVTFKVSPAPVLETCNTLDGRGHYVIDLNKPGANAWLSMVLSAKAAQTDVQVWGTSKCIGAGSAMGEELETIAIN